MELLRLVFELEFLGTHFCGSQSQKNSSNSSASKQRTVQDVFENAISIFFRQELKIVLASRVDAGVHAESMIGHFDLPVDLLQNCLPERERLTPVNSNSLDGLKGSFKHICRHINGILPWDLCIKNLALAPENSSSYKFHSLKDAISRSYVYTINVSSQRSPLSEGQSWFVRDLHELDLCKLNEQAQLLLGEHDFTGLSNYKKNTKVNPVCKVFNCSWAWSQKSPVNLPDKLPEPNLQQDKSQIEFRISADHFIYNMIRVIVGTQIAILNGRISIYSLQKALSSKDRRFAGPTAPAVGLCLKAIEYPFNLFT